MSASAVPGGNCRRTAGCSGSRALGGLPLLYLTAWSHGLNMAAVHAVSDIAGGLLIGTGMGVVSSARWAC